MTWNRTGPGFLGILGSDPNLQTHQCILHSMQQDLDPGANFVLFAQIAELHVGCTKPLIDASSWTRFCHVLPQVLQQNNTIQQPTIRDYEIRGPHLARHLDVRKVL